MQTIFKGMLLLLNYIIVQEEKNFMMSLTYSSDAIGKDLLSFQFHQSGWPMLPKVVSSNPARVNSFPCCR